MWYVFSSEYLAADVVLVDSKKLGRIGLRLEHAAFSGEFPFH